MEEFYLYDENGKSLPIEEGFPENYLEEYGIPGARKCHAFFGKYPLLFQAIKVGKYEIAKSDYLTRHTGKLTCHASAVCLEIHFILTGKALINLRGLGWTKLEAGTHNMIVLSGVKNETFTLYK